jgi:hypothetical protein
VALSKVVYKCPVLSPLNSECVRDAMRIARRVYKSPVARKKKSGCSP